MNWKGLRVPAARSLIATKSAKQPFFCRFSAGGLPELVLCIRGFYFLTATGRLLRFSQMKILLTVSALLALSACNLQGLVPSDPSGPSTDQQHMRLATQNGYEEVARTDVSSADIRLYAANKHEIFNGVDAQDKLAAIALNSPENVGIDSSAATGEITIQFRNETKVLNIKSGPQGQFVEDAAYPQIHYRALSPLDSTWIKP